MVTYRLVNDRWEVFKRSDGTLIPLLPKPYCQWCADPIHPNYQETGMCYNCYSGDTRVDVRNLFRVYATSVYIKRPIRNYVLSNEIIKCKKNPTKYAQGLAEILEYGITTMYPELKSCGMLVPTPRGSKTARINHVVEIVKELSSRIGIPYKDPLVKIEDYPSQRTLNKEERIENVRDKIGCEENVSRKVIVVDDTMTTGATLLNSGKALKSSGAKLVVGLVVGRTVNKDHLVYIGALEEER